VLKYNKKLSRIPPEICSLDDYEKAAKSCLPQSTWEYISSGSGDEVSLANNHSVFRDIKIWNRPLKPLSHGHTRCQVAHLDLEHPIILGPVAHQKLVDPEGELSTVRAAEATNTAMVLSTLASQSIETVAATGVNNLWFQLYWQGEKESTLSLLRRAENSGYEAIVVTVDVPINGLRRRIQRSGFVLPMEAAAVNTDSKICPQALSEGQSEVFQGWMSLAPTWSELSWIISQTKLPVFVKGILHPNDAKLAQDAGAVGLILSNHGGRALDAVPSALEVIHFVRQTCGEDYPLMVDGGVRQGSDVFKALAVGANAVLIGRPQFYGLAVAGALGVAHLVQLLRKELEVTMALAGCATISDISYDCLFNKESIV